MAQAEMVRIEQWRAFPRVTAEGNAGGNPCPLVTDARRLTSTQMQAIAAHYGQESAFVTDAAASGVRLRYFVPRHEMRMCVHATIAAATALISTGALAGGRTVISTASGRHEVSWQAGNSPEVTVEQHPPSFGPPATIHGELTAALGLIAGSIPAAAEIRPVSVSRAKLIVPVRDAETVHQCQPDFPALWDLCRRHDATGAYVFAPHPDGDPLHVVARQFPVDAGFPEDPATGVAAAALAAYLAGHHRPRPGQPAWTRIAIDQGDAMGHPSRLYAAALAGPGGITRTSVTGQAIRVGHDELSLDALASGPDLPEPELR
jgi:PhzF family phenazine biosynthesis protein